MLPEYTADYLLDKKVKIFQPVAGYRASTDAVLLAAFVSGFKHGTILDVGSGTGAVSLCLAERLKKISPQITGLELQPELAELANFSAARNAFGSLSYKNADIRLGTKANGLSPCSFDVVVTNPPYSEHDLPSPNPSKALAHNHSDFSLAHWLEFCLKMTKPQGKIYMVNRAEALPLICSCLQNKAGNLTILPVYSKCGQTAKRILLSAQKDSKAPCRVLPPFFTHSENGEYSPEAQKILRSGSGFEEIIPVLR
ncbi:MAG: methyltransferase domain-containing protein [Pseudomonadota bacterium]|nr:methyltransferase domain-containing protein [Pseudomonadota bacterium]